MSVLPVQYYSCNPEFNSHRQKLMTMQRSMIFSLLKLLQLYFVCSCEGVNCRFHLAIPQGYFGKIFSRSGLTRHHSITAESGVIDSDY